MESGKVDDREPEYGQPNKRGTVGRQIQGVRATEPLDTVEAQ